MSGLRGENVEIVPLQNRSFVRLPPHFGPVVYERSKQQERVRRVLQDSREEERVARVLLVMPFLKHKGYEEEREWRLVGPRLSLDGSTYESLEKPEFRFTRDGIAQYRPFHLVAPDKDEYPGFLPKLIHVKLGPRNKSHVGDVRSYLERHDYRGVGVSGSKASYRG